MPDFADWMMPMDYRILELLERTRAVTFAGMWLKPTTIGMNLDATRQYMSDRLRTLEEHGFVESNELHFYRITDLGTEWLHDRIDVSEV